jgi:hypothetical protein
MKTRFCKQIFIGALLALLFIPTTTIGEDIDINSPIKIDRHWIYILQQDDSNIFEVSEYFFINNTGESTYNDSFYLWIQNNSIIGTTYCNNTPNMACRYSPDYTECFYFNKTDNNNIYVGYPVLSINRLSYYGQRESISITVFSTINTSLDDDTLHLNATIDGQSLSRKVVSFQGIGIHLTSDNHEVGIPPILETNMPCNITTNENLTIYNNGTETEILGFIISDLPKGWNAEIWNETVKLNNISLAPKEYINLTLKITAPSNIASLYVRYTTQVNIDGNNARGLFTKQYLYETELVTYEVYLLKKEKVEVSEDLNLVHDKLFWIDEYDRYWFYAKNEDILPGSYTTINMSLEYTEDEQSNPYIMLVLICIIILIIFILMLKKFDFFKEKETSTKQDKSLENRIKKLEEHKKKVLTSIKRVEKEYEDGIISKEDYERFRVSYKKRAIEILKEIDRLEE